MRLIFFIALIGTFSGLRAQINDVTMPGEYIDAHNYGGKNEFKRFIMQEMNYPREAMLNNVQGTVEVAAIIDNKTGIPSKIHVKNSVSKELDAEAVRLYKMMLFTPTFYKGDNVMTYSTLKFKFSTKNFRRARKKRGYHDALETYKESTDTFRVYTENEVKVKPKILLENPLENISTFIQKNIKYPQGTLSLNITGDVKLVFIIEPTGRLTNIKVQRPVGGGATEEAVRLLKLMKWKAGETGGEAVRVRKVFEVTFNLKNEPGMGVLPNSY